MPLSYVWSDNQTPQVASGVDAVLNVEVDPATIVEPWIVTLTVTDDEGAVSVMHRTVPIQRESPAVSVAGLYVAAKSHATAAPGGHLWWYEETAGSGNWISCACSPVSAGVAVFGKSNGTIYRTTDFLRTAPTLVYSGFSEEITDIEWDVTAPDRVWALTRSGRVLVSNDEGATWGVHSSLRDSLSEPRLVAYRMDSQARGVASVLRVFGGDGHGEPIIAYAIIPTSGWIRVGIGGELREDLDSINDAALYVADGTSAGRDLAIILNSASHHPAVYYTPDMLDASQWKRGLGSIDGALKTRGRWIERDLEDGYFVMGVDGVEIYIGRVNGSDALQTWAAIATLPANNAAQHGYWLGRSIHGMSGVFLVSAEQSGGDGGLYKTTDRFATLEEVRASPVGGGDAMMVAVGPAATPLGLYVIAQASEPPGAAVLYDADVLGLSRGNWALLDDPAAASQAPYNWTREFDGILFRSKGDNGAQEPGNLERSTDGGATWAQVFAVTSSGGEDWGVVAMAQAGDGRLWLCTRSSVTTVAALPSPAIYVSDDQGATWDLAYQDTTQDDAEDRVMSDIACHPTDPMLIYVVGGRHGGEMLHWFSDDGGVTFSVYAGGGSVDAAHQRQCVMLANRRVILMETSAGNLRYSDDFGASWSGTILSIGGTTPGQLLRNRAGTVAFVSGGAGANAHVWRTQTFGASWEQFVNATLTLPSTFEWQSLAYHEESDGLVAGSSVNSGDIQRAVLIRNATDTDYDVIDLTINLDDLIGSQQLGRQGIMLA